MPITGTVTKPGPRPPKSRHEWLFLSPNTEEAKRLQAVTGMPSVLQLANFNHKDVPDDLEHALKMVAPALGRVRT